MRIFFLSFAGTIDGANLTPCIHEKKKRYSLSDRSLLPFGLI